MFYWKIYIRDPSGLFSIISHVKHDFGNFPSKFVGVLRLLNFTYTFFKVLLIFSHCRALFRSVLFLKIIVTSVLYCCTVNLSRRNYFLANKNLLFYRCLFVYIIKRTYEFYFLVAKTIFYSLAALVRKILFCHSKIKFISSRHRVISSIYRKIPKMSPSVYQPLQT